MINRSSKFILVLFFQLSCGNFVICANIDIDGKKLTKQNIVDPETALLFKKADVEWASLNLSKYKNTSFQILEMSYLKGDTLSIAKSFIYIGDYYNNKYIDDSAYYYYFKAEKWFRYAKFSRGTISALLRKGQIQYSYSDYIGAENSAFQALRLSKSSGTTRQIFQAYNLLGNIFYDLEEHENAIKYHYKAEELLKLFNGSEFTEMKNISHCNIGLVLIELKDYVKALKHFDEALNNLGSQPSNPSLYANLLANSWYCKVKLNRKVSQKDIFEAIRINDSLKFNSRLVLDYLKLSQYNFTNGDQSSAIKYAKSALFYSRKADPICILFALKQLIATDPENSAKYSKEYIAINDSLQLAERRIRNKFARIEYETDEIEIEKDQAIKDKWIYVSTTSSAFALLSLLFIIYRQKHRQREIRLRHEQQLANEEIYQLLLNQQTKVMEGRQGEKNRISRDLHDGVMNQLTSTRLNLFALTKDQSPQGIQDCMPFINGLKDIEDEVRNISHELHKEFEPGNHSFKFIIDSLLAAQNTASDANIHLSVDPAIDWDKVSGTFKLNLYRILQESLQNINKHALAKNIYVNFILDHTLLKVEVIDDGVGFDTSKEKNGIGLKNIAQRVAEMNGKIDIQSNTGEGTKIKLLFSM